MNDELLAGEEVVRRAVRTILVWTGGVLGAALAGAWVDARCASGLGVEMAMPPDLGAGVLLIGAAGIGPQGGGDVRAFR